MSTTKKHCLSCGAKTWHREKMVGYNCIVCNAFLDSSEEDKKDKYKKGRELSVVGRATIELCEEPFFIGDNLFQRDGIDVYILLGNDPKQKHRIILNSKLLVGKRFWEAVK